MFSLQTTVKFTNNSEDTVLNLQTTVKTWTSIHKLQWKHNFQFTKCSVHKLQWKQCSIHKQQWKDCVQFTNYSENTVFNSQTTMKTHNLILPLPSFPPFRYFNTTYFWHFLDFIKYGRVTIKDTSFIDNPPFKSFWCLFVCLLFYLCTWFFFSNLSLFQFFFFRLYCFSSKLMSLLSMSLFLTERKYCMIFLYNLLYITFLYCIAHFVVVLFLTFHFCSQFPCFVEWNLYIFLRVVHREQNNTNRLYFPL